MKKFLNQSYQTAFKALQNFIEDEKNIDQTGKISELIAQAFHRGNKVLICGNGGSLCDAAHFAEEFTGRYRKNRRALPVIAIADPAHLTCSGNDYGFENIFSRGVEAYGSSQDVLIVLSTSGNSPNIIHAVNKAEQMNITTVGLLGKDGGKLVDRCDYQFVVGEQTSDRIQEIHMVILHIIIEGVERILFPENYV